MQEKNTRKNVFVFRIKELMLSNNLKQKDLEAISGIPQSRISDYILGKTTPSADAICRLASVFEVTMDWLWGANDDQPEQPKSNEKDEIKLLRSKLQIATSMLQATLKEIQL